MINLAVREVTHTWFRYFLTAFGLGLLIGVTMTMAGVVRGMIDDATAVITAAQADIWVVQDDTLGPYAEVSVLYDDVARTIAGLPGVAETGNVIYFTLQARHNNNDMRVMVAGFEPGRAGEPPRLVAGRPITQSRYEAIADGKTGFKLGDQVKIRRNHYTVVGLTDGIVSSGGDPVVFLSLRDAQEVQFQKDNTSIYNDRDRLAANPQLNRPGAPGVLQAVTDMQTTNNKVNAVLVRVTPGYDANSVAENIRRWKHLGAFTLAEQQEILQAKVVYTAVRQVGLFLVILTVVSIAIVALIIYTMTMGKIKEIAVLKLIGAKNSTIAGMILQEALGLGLIGFVLGKITSTFWAPFFPKNIVFMVSDSIAAFFFTMLVCVIASLIGIRAALKVQPAAAMGG